jgi:hypothetical protein
MQYLYVCNTTCTHNRLIVYVCKPKLVTIQKITINTAACYFLRLSLKETHFHIIFYIQASKAAAFSGWLVKSSCTLTFDNAVKNDESALQHVYPSVVSCHFYHAVLNM